MSIIYKRTSKGEEEIKKRTHKLDHEHRFVLIMIDGKASSEDVVSRSSVHWKPAQCLLELEALGFIENINPELGANSEIGKLKQSLILVVQTKLPNNHKKIVNKILNAELTKTALLNAIDSGCMFIKLTVSEGIADSLKIELHEVVNNSQEV